MTIINSINKGKQPVIDTLNVTPTTSAQQITATGGTDGYSPVNVSAVTSSIDANIVAGNIKSGVSILGVSGSVVELNGSTETVTPTTSQQTITPTSPSNGLTSVTVNAVTSAIDANIVAGNIKDGVSILGVTGNYQGTQPTGTIQITTNGIHDVTNYASADVQVPTTAPAYYIEKAVSSGRLINSANMINLNGVADVGSYVLAHAYYGVNFPANTSVDLSSLTTLNGTYSCQYMFGGCTGITSVDLSSLATVSGQSACNNMFYGSGITSIDLSSLTTVSGNSACNGMFGSCTNLASVDLSSLKTISGIAGCQYMFQNCTGLTSINLSSLTTASTNNACYAMFNGCTGITSVDLSSLTSGRIGYMLWGCTSLTSVDLSSLASITATSACSYLVAGCTSLTSISFPSLNSNSFGSYTNQFNNMLNGVTGCTVHFPSNLQSVIGSWSDVTGGFGGTNTTVLYDLPATNTLTGVDTVTYTRNPKYDTATALAWKVGAYGTTNFTPAYYTSGLTDPTVGTTIYSDAACTVSVTTVDTVA